MKRWYIIGCRSFFCFSSRVDRKCRSIRQLLQKRIGQSTISKEFNIEAKISRRAPVSYNSKNNKYEVCSKYLPLKFKDIFTLELLFKGFRKLKNNNLGVDGYIKGNWKMSTFKKLESRLLNQSYKPKPCKVVFVSKLNGGKRPLGIASPKDKVVQMLIKQAFESKWEAVFFPHSHGFRVKRSCHTALKEIRHGWVDVNWLFSLELKTSFNLVNYKVLIDILKGGVSYYSCPGGWGIDKAIEDLLWKIVRVGYVDVYNLNDRSRYDLCVNSVTKIPKNSVISPLFANIYFHQLDKQLQKLQEGLQRSCIFFGKKQGLNCQICSKFNFCKLHMKKKVVGRKTTFSKIRKDFFDKHMYWVRYADEVLIGVCGSYDDCKYIYEKIYQILEFLYLSISLTKVVINFSKVSQTNYLGANLLTPSKRLLVTIFNNNLKELSCIFLTKLQLYIPIQDIIFRLVIKGYVCVLADCKSYQAMSLIQYQCFSEFEIVKHFSSLIRGLVSYYRFASQRFHLWKILYLLRKSCVLTLASKLNIRDVSLVCRKFGRSLQLYNNGKLKESLYYPTSLKIFPGYYTGFGTSLFEVNEIAAIISVFRVNNLYFNNTCEFCQSSVRVDFYFLEPVIFMKILVLYKKFRVEHRLMYLSLCYICYQTEIYSRFF